MPNWECCDESDIISNNNQQAFYEYKPSRKENNKHKVYLSGQGILCWSHYVFTLWIKFLLILDQKTLNILDKIMHAYKIKIRLLRIQNDQ